MKKLVFVLIAALSVALTGCSTFESKPIEPKIIGTGNLQYEKKSNTWFVIIDSIQYTITNVTIPDHNPRTMGNTQNIEPVDGMQVTLFTSPHVVGLQAVTGRQSAEQIEALYHRNFTGVVIFSSLFLLCLVSFCFEPKQKVPVVKTDT